MKGEQIMNKIMIKMKEKKGFTLAELLIVVAIIAVLVAIAIPIFTSQLEKSKEATDQANIRSAYAEVMSAALTDTGTTHDTSLTRVSRSGSAGSYTWSSSVNLKQSQNGWQGPAEDIGGVNISTMTPNVGHSCTISYTEGNANATITFN